MQRGLCPCHAKVNREGDDGVLRFRTIASVVAAILIFFATHQTLNKHENVAVHYYIVQNIISKLAVHVGLHVILITFFSEVRPDGFEVGHSRNRSLDTPLPITFITFGATLLMLCCRIF